MAKSSLFGSKAAAPETPGTAMALPTGAGLASMPVPEPRSSAPYVWFASRKATDRWPDVEAQLPNLQEGDPVLIIPDRAPVRCHPLTYFLLDAFGYFATLDAEFKPHRAWSVRPEGVNATEFVHAWMLVQHDGTLTPATCRFRGAKCKGFYQSRSAYDDATKPDWGTRSAEHAQTMVIPQPNLRFKSVLTVSPPRKSRGGHSYQGTSVRIVPTTLGDGAMFAKIKDDAELREMLTAAKDSFEEWNDGIRRLWK